MNAKSRVDGGCLRRWSTGVLAHCAQFERRRTGRVQVRLAFDVYERERYLGRFWSRDLSQEGLFLETGTAAPLLRRILSLHFRADGVERQVRGTTIHEVPGAGVGIQLAFWRSDDQADQSAYRRLISNEAAADGVNEPPAAQPIPSVRPHLIPNKV